MEEVEIEIKQNFVDLNPSHRRFNDERSEYVKKFTETSNHKHDTNEVEKLENENSYDSEWGDLNIEWADHELCSDLTELSDWDDLDNNEEKEDTHYKDDFLGYEDFLAYEETDEAKRNVRFLLYSYEAAIHKLFQCYRYIRVKEFEIIAQEILLVKIEDLQAVFNEYMSRFFVGGRKHEYCDSDRLVGLLCISRIFFIHDRTDHFRFLCSLAEDVINYLSEGPLRFSIQRYLEIQFLKNSLCTFDDMCTGISHPKFESHLKLCYCTKMLCETQRNATDKSIEENLKYFISSFDEVTENRKYQFETKKRIFHSLIQTLNKSIVQEDVKNIKFTLAVLQKIIRNFVIVDCFEIFKKCMFRDRSLTKTSELKFEVPFYSIPLEEDLLKSVCGFIMEFLQCLKLIRKTFHSVIEVSTIFVEIKCIYRCLIDTIDYISREEELDSEIDLEYGECGPYEELLILDLDDDKATILPIYVDTFVDYSEDKGIVNIIKEICDRAEMTWINKDIVLKSISDIASIRYHKQRCQLAKIILDINLIKVKGDFLTHQITLILWDLLKISDKRKSKNNIETHMTAMKTKLQHKFVALNHYPMYREEDVYDENEKEKKTILYRCICILRNAKKQAQFCDVNITNYTNAFNLDEQSLENEDQAGKKSNTEIMLIIMLLLLVASTRHHKSAKLKKYLSQKYEYKEAILYILWCSGDIHINPGPPMKKSQLLHDSQRERAWIQDMSSILLKLYKGEPPHSKPNNLWREKPEHWPSNKPFYDTKNHPHDEYKCFISDHELLICLIQCCNCKKVNINKIYQKEITAWTENQSQLLHKLHTFRTETEKIKIVLQNLLLYKDTDDLKEALYNINVKLCLKIGDSDLKYVPCKRVKNQSEMIADITRYLAAVVCKIIKKKDPESKCDGIWTTPPEQWPPNVPFFSPFNRGKCKDTCSDQLLLSTLLQHPKAVIPPKYKSLVESYQNVVNATDKKEAKKHKEVLCRVKTIQTEVSVLDYALTYLHSDGFFTTEVCHPLHQWWSSQNVENQTEVKFANQHRISEERPEIRIEVTRKCMTLSVNMDYPTKSSACYSISFDDSLPTTLDSNIQHCSDIDQLCNDDNSQGISVNKNSQIQQKSSSEVISSNGSNHGTDSQPSSLINIDTETDFSVENESLFTGQTQSPAEYHSLSFSELKKSKENTTSPKVRSLSKREETVAKDSDGTNFPTKVSGINTGQSGDNRKFIVPGTTKSYELTTKMTKSQKRKYSNESNGNGISKSMLMENDIQDNSVHKKTGEEPVSDNQFDIDFLLEDCIDDISFQHESTSEVSKNESSLRSAEDEIMDISLPVSTDYDEVSDGLELLLDDLINYESGKKSRLEKELLLDSL